MRTLTELGYSADQQEALQAAVRAPGGMVLIAGIAGAGKTTTLATCVALAAKEQQRIVGVGLVDVERFVISLTALRGEASAKMAQMILRTGADVLVLDEIRDEATALLAWQCTQAGMKVLATIHASGATVCYDRLAGLGINRGLLSAPGIVAAIAYQRLLPSLITDPAQTAGRTFEEPAEYLVRRSLDVINGTLPDRRTACAEILRPTPDMLNAIANGNNPELWRLWRATRHEADSGDMTGRTAYEHGLWKVRNGLVSRQAFEDAMGPILEEEAA